MHIIDDERMNTNYARCKECGGRCCQRNACDCSPKDFNNEVAEMRKALESGNYTIDYSREDARDFEISRFRTVLITERVIEERGHFFYIRPKNVGRPIVDIVHDEEKEGPCIFWSKDSGCALTYKERPTGGRTYVPYELGICLPQYHVANMLLEWKPFVKDLAELAKEFWDPTWDLYQRFNLEIE